MSQLRAQSHLLGGEPPAFRGVTGVPPLSGPAQESGGPIIIGPTIGRPGNGEVPTMADLAQDAPTGVITGTVNLRPGPSASGDVITQLFKDDQVTVVEPQPGNGVEGWLYVSVQRDGQPELNGWVTNGYNGLDWVDQLPRPVDERVQERMTELGYIPDGAEMTDGAIASFQLMNGLPGTGVLDDDTLAAMWSGDARISTHITQVYDPIWNHTTELETSSNCGPTSVAMGLAAVGLQEIDNQDPQASVAFARNHAGGTSADTTGPDDLVNAVIAGGGTTTRLADRDEVQDSVVNGDPVIVFGHRPDGEAHYVLVVGYDPASDSFLVSDPLGHQGVERWTRDQLKIYDDYSVHDGIDYDAIGIHNPNN